MQHCQQSRSFHRYLVLDILANPNRVTLIKKKSTANFAVCLLLYIVLLEGKICPFTKKLASHTSMQKKEDKVSNKKKGKKKKQKKNQKKSQNKHTNSNR